MIISFIRTPRRTRGIRGDGKHYVALLALFAGLVGTRHAAAQVLAAPEKPSIEPKAAGVTPKAPPPPAPEPQLPETPSSPIPLDGSPAVDPQSPGKSTARGPSSKRFTNDRPRELWSEEKQDAYHGAGDDSDEVSVIDFIDSEVVSASNQAESSLTAPAWIISLSAQDLRDRGYADLTEMLDDLPSMDIVRPYGSPYLKNYWRGYRNAIGAPYLLMVDGVILNSLFANDTTVFGAIPLTSIEHVEIVYGPASAVYGPNAAMGVINVITNRGAGEKGLHTDLRISLGAPTQFSFRNQTKIADTSLRYNGDGFRVLASARFEFGVLDPTIGSNFEWTKEEYYRSPHWRRFGSLPGVGEGFRSPDEKEGVSLRLVLGQHAACGDRDVKSARGQCTEISVEHYEHTVGKGTLRPAPIAQTRPTTTFLEQGAQIRHIQDLSSSLTSDSKLRYRTSAIDKSSQELFYFSEQGISGIAGARLGNEGDAWILTQDFNLNVGKNLLLSNDVLSFKLGARYSRVSLDHDLIYSDVFVDLRTGDNFTQEQTEDLTERATERLKDELSAEAVDSRSNLDTGGAYLLGFYSIAQTHYLNAGLRLDYSQSHDDIEPTIRAGYVGRLSSNFTVKALFGQAFQEPTVGELLGAQSEEEEMTLPADQGMGETAPAGPRCIRNCQNTGLRSETSQTFELSVNYLSDYAAMRVGGFYVSYHDAMVLDETNTVTNAKTRNVLGTDLSARALFPLWPEVTLSIWAYYSMLAVAEQTDLSTTTDDTNDAALVPIGDLAKNKLLGGLTLRGDTVALTILGRFIGLRETFASNPLNVNAYSTMDANLVLNDTFVRGLSLGLRATNLLDTVYFHPGLQDASSGEDPDSFNANFEWTAGEYNSLLPQPGRRVFLTLSLEL